MNKETKVRARPAAITLTSAAQDRIAVLADLHVVDQTELVNVDRDFRIVDRLQRIDDIVLQIFVSDRFVGRLGLARQETG